MSRKNFIIWTLLAFLVPLYYSVIWQVYLQSAVLIAVIISSIPYHIYDSKVFIEEDKLSAWALVLVNTLLIVLGGFTLPYSALALLFAMTAFYFYKVNNTGYSHGYWHVVSAAVSLFSLMTYYL